MKRNLWHRLGLLKMLPLVAVVLLGVTLSNAQDIDQQIDHIQMLSDVANSIKADLGPDGVNALSASSFQFVAFGDQVEFLKGVLDGRKASNPLAPEDLLSRIAGSTQSETSVAWCGSNVVIGFNDSGSLAITMIGPSPSPSASFSVNGWSVSNNAGGRFNDRNVLVSDPLPAGTRFLDLRGDPVVRCSNQSTFYYASLANQFLTGPPGFRSAITVSKSTDGGQSFGGTVVAVGKSGGHTLDKDWMDVKSGPSGNDIIHVVYTDFDSSPPPRPVCGSLLRTAIEYVRSTDGGATWSAPAVIDTVCGSTPFVQGSQVAVGLGSEVYVAWEAYPSGFSAPTRQIRLRKSLDGGASFGPIVTVRSPVIPVGTGQRMQGLFRNFIDLGGLAVDRSRGPNSGNVYITFQDGSNLSQRDFFASPGCRGLIPGPTGPYRYCFADVYLTGSTDGGATWAVPVRVNNDPITQAADQFMPAVAVDRNGQVHVIYYDRSRDPRNILIDAFAAHSPNGGLSWLNERLTATNFPVIIAQDGLVNSVYMGDYIGIAADAEQGQAGVILAWGDNSLGDPNVWFAKR